MWLPVAIIVLIIYYFGMQADKGMTIRHTRDMYNSAINTKGISYYDIGSKCRRCVKTNLPVSEYIGYDNNHEEFVYTVFVVPSLMDNPPRLLVNTGYKWKEKRGQKVPVSDEWLQRNNLIRIQDYKAKYNPIYLRSLDLDKLL